MEQAAKPFGYNLRLCVSAAGLVIVDYFVHVEYTNLLARGDDVSDRF